MSNVLPPKPKGSIAQLPKDGSKLALMEDFYTLQGEGCFSGQAAWFIRLAGCTVGCPWCDVKESWDADQHPTLATEEIVARAVQGTPKASIAVITGGEPAHYNLGPLTAYLHEKGFRTHIETSGAGEFSGEWDWICLSPKKFKAPQEDWVQKAQELKVIVFNKSDFEWAQKWAQEVSGTCKKLIQPEWGKAKEMMPLIVEFVKQNPDWQVSLQTHKYLGIP